MKIRVAGVLGMAVVGTMFLVGCGEEPGRVGVAERSGSAVGRASEKTVEAVTNAAGYVVDKTGEVMEKAGGAVERAGERMQK